MPAPETRHNMTAEQITINDSEGSVDIDVDLDVSDDGTSLSLGMRKPKSYLGGSSVHAILKLVFLLCPEFTPVPVEPSSTGRIAQSHALSSRPDDSLQKPALTQGPFVQQETRAHIFLSAK